ncbi:hypothetical protein V6N11_032189 [Hibiscus sabdariffa]|uniref:Uncharacterized protein n=1 Tax=Hibiscus sabdariffa TaxID=183260 RepID=A0ABR2SZX7_9ROSI
MEVNALGHESSRSPISPVQEKNDKSVLTTKKIAVAAAGGLLQEIEDSGSGSSYFVILTPYFELKTIVEGKTYFYVDEKDMDPRLLLLR